MIPILSKLFSKHRQKKSFSNACVTSWPNASFVNFLTLRGHHNLAAHQAINYYRQVAAAGTSIDTIAREISSLQPLLFNQKDNQFTLSHPLLTFLQRPNADSTWNEFMTRLSAFRIITGNSYIWASSQGGKPDSPLLELMVINPQNVSFNSDGNGNISSITLTNEKDNKGGTFFPQETAQLGLRFYDNLGNELWQIKDFNPASGAVVGMSRLVHIFFELEQSIESSRHNWSLLKNGMRPTVMIIPEDDLAPDAQEMLKDMVKEFQVGSENAGRPIFGGGVKEVKDLIKSNRDMDFVNLKKSILQCIYNGLNFPLALVSSDNMTFSNLGQARELLYDNAVLPEAKRTFNELTNMIIHRYPDAEDSRITFNQHSIPALRDRQVRQAKEKSEIGAYTRDEVRKDLGDEPLAEGGDVILGPVSEVPNAVDGFTDDQPKPPKKLYLEAMEQYGLPYDELNEIADKAGL